MARKPLSGFGIVTEVDKHLTADKVTVTLRVFNETRQDIKLDFQYWPVHDVVIRDKEGKEIWRESHGRFYTQNVSTATIPPSITVKKGKPHIFECTWNLTDNDKKRVGSGKYTVEGVVNSTPCAMKANTIVEVGFKALDEK